MSLARLGKDRQISQPGMRNLENFRTFGNFNKNYSPNPDKIGPSAAKRDLFLTIWHFYLSK